MGTIRRATPERLTELARGLATGRMVVPNLEDRAWQASLALLATGGAFKKLTNLGLVLVPLDGVNGRGYWINGTAPACTWEVVLVAKGDVPALRRQWQEMYDALHPEEAR